MAFSKISLAFGAVLETEPVRRLPRLGETPSGILAAAGMLAEMVPDTRRGALFESGEPNFIAQSECLDLSN
jgi:hypothetical protein